MSRFGPTASSKPFSDRSWPTTARSPASDSTRPSSAPPPVIRPVTSVPLTWPSKPTRALVKARSISLPWGISAATVTSIGWPSPEAWPRAVTAPASRGSTSARSERLASKPMSVCLLENLPVRGEGELRVGDLEIVGADAGLVAHRAAGDRGAAGEERVEAGVAEREVGRATLEAEIEAAAERGDAAVGAQVDRTRQLPVRDPREDRHVGDMHGAAPGEDQLFELPRGEDGKPVAGELELAERERAARRKRCVGEEVDPAAERAGDLGVGGPDAGREPLDVDGDVALGGVLEVLREAAEAEGHVLHLDVGRLQPVEGDEAAPAAAAAEIDVELGRMQAGAAARHRQQHRLPGRVAERAGQRQAAQEAVVAGREPAVELQHRAGEAQLVDAQAAGRLLDAGDLDRALAGEEVAELLRHQRRQPAAEVDVEAEPVVARAEGDGALGDARLVGVEAEVDVDVVERARALHLEVDRGRALDLEQRRDDAALGLLQPEVDVELAGLVGEAGLELQLAPRGVEALDVECRVERAAGEVEGAGHVELGALSEDFGREAQRPDRELADLDRHRQLGQRERLGLGARERALRRRRFGAAQPGDPVGGEPGDVDPPAQQREPAPVELGVVDLQPGALVVRDGDARDPRLRRERTGNAAQPDLPAGRRELVFEEVQQKAVVAVGLARVLRQRGDGDDQQDREEGRETLQNACPMPM